MAPQLNMGAKTCTGGTSDRGFPTYAVFTTADTTAAISDSYMHKWGIFVLVGEPLQSSTMVPVCRSGTHKIKYIKNYFYLKL